VPIRFEYDGMVFEEGFRADLIVDHQVIVELKSVERLAPVYAKKLLTYLRLTNKRVGLLINFGANTLSEGLRRVVNNLPASASPRLREPKSSRATLTHWLRERARALTQADAVDISSHRAAQRHLTVSRTHAFRARFFPTRGSRRVVNSPRAARAV